MDILEKPASARLFDKVLVANRGEIAVRIIKTLKKMGISSVAIYSDVDNESLHVKYADEAYYVGSAPSTESYLSINNILDAVRRSGANAVHPGYGFLSENPLFAKTLQKAKVTLIGPSEYAIKTMGDKVEAKKIAIKSGVNTVPGYMGIIDDENQAITIAEEIGFPVILKAAAGGGGRGMRVVRSPHEMPSAFASAQLEAQNCFNNNSVFIEKLIDKPRHIEIQVLADRFGNVVCLGERECSIQRYHQKVIEEAPSPFITPETRTQMYQQCVQLAKTVGYYSAGTVEFMVDQSGEFYFLEMNTRLQVEHCVTELITGVDIVEQMVRIAAGMPLSFSQQDIVLKGSAIEARIYAEDPTRGFLPSSGRISVYREPPLNPHIRIDSGVCAGGEVSMFYDAMIAKLCTHHDSRAESLEQMKNALGRFVIRGISHNISFLEAIISHPRFMAGDIDTHFIEDEYPDGFGGVSITSEISEHLIATAVYIHIAEERRNALMPGQTFGQYNKIGGRWVVKIDNQQYHVMVKEVDGGANIRHENTRIYLRTNWQIGDKIFSGTVNERVVHVKIEHIPTGYELTHAGSTIKVFVRSPRIAELESIVPSTHVSEDDSDIVTAPLTGQVVALKVSSGDSVKYGDELFILTAMKMENIIYAQKDGIIDKALVKPGDHVSTGQTVLQYVK